MKVIAILMRMRTACVKAMNMYTHSIVYNRAAKIVRGQFIFCFNPKVELTLPLEVSLIQNSVVPPYFDCQSNE